MYVWLCNFFLAANVLLLYAEIRASDALAGWIDTVHDVCTHRNLV